MGYFFRRSTSIGPFRLNFSKSGIGASVGVRGARLTMTPRGTTYVTVGSHGFYYRESLSNRGRSQVYPETRPAVVQAVPRQPDEIVTADVSDLGDSSSEALIEHLNERARMFNPAWLLYFAAVVVTEVAVAIFSSTPDLTETASPRNGETGTRVDEYSVLVVRYGYPASVVATNPLGVVPARTANYSSANVKVVFTPTECVGVYNQAVGILADESHRSASAKKVKNLKPCAASPDSGWAIVRCIDSTDNSTISTETARLRLGVMTGKQSSPPAVEIESIQPKKQTASSRSLTGKQSAPNPGTNPSKQTWTVQEQVRHNAEAADRRGWQFGSAALTLSVGLLVAGIVIHKKNTEKRTSRLFYELTGTEAENYNLVRQALNHLAQSQRMWRIEGEAATSDWKRNAGASSLVRRNSAAVTSEAPPRVKTNVSTPCLHLGGMRFFFMPDVILCWQHGTFGAVSYRDFQVRDTTTRFIEDGWVPSDATVVDRTWRYVNKSGGPDRRFNNNAQLPVVKYGVLYLSSTAGLNIHLNISSAGSSLAFANCWREIQSRLSGSPQPKSPPTQPTADTPAGPLAQAFQILGVSPGATPDEISGAYRRLAQMYHPDKVAGLAPEFQVLADKRMKEINAAYEVLKAQA